MMNNILLMVWNLLCIGIQVARKQINYKLGIDYNDDLDRFATDNEVGRYH